MSSQQITDSVFAKLGNLVHMMEQEKPDTNAPQQEHIYHQVMSNCLEEAFFKMEKLINKQRIPIPVDGVCNIIPEPVRLDLSIQMINALADGMLEYGNRQSKAIITDDGISCHFMITLNKGGDDARIVYQSESIQ